MLVDIASVGGAGVGAGAGGIGEGGVAVSSATGKDASILISAKYFVQADSFRFVG